MSTRNGEEPLPFLENDHNVKFHLSSSPKACSAHMYSRPLAKLNLQFVILRTCRKICHEGLEVFYGDNKFLHMSEYALFILRFKEWLFMKDHIHTDLHMQLLNPATTMPFLKKIRHLVLCFGHGLDFSVMLSTMYCVRKGICNLKTLGAVFMVTWADTEIKHFLYTLKNVQVSHSITLTAYRLRNLPGRSICQVVDEVLASWESIGRYKTRILDLPSRSHQPLQGRQWVLTVKKSLLCGCKDSGEPLAF